MPEHTKADRNEKTETPGKEEETNPIDSPEKVPASNDEKIDQDFPGYPHYPANEDILSPDNNTGKEDVDVENLSRANNVPHENLEEARRNPSNNSKAFKEPAVTDGDAGLGQQPANDSDVTKEDLQNLGPKDRDMDMGPDERIPDELEVTGADLDVPGAELDDDNEAIGEEDEENNYYSLGGDNHEDLEQDTRNNY